MKKIEDWKLALYFMLVLYGVIMLVLISQMNKLHYEWRSMQQQFEFLKYQVYTPAVGIIKDYM